MRHAARGVSEAASLRVGAPGPLCMCRAGDVRAMAMQGAVRAGARACSNLALDAVLVDDDTRNLVGEVLARAEDEVAAGEVGHLDALGRLERRLVEARAVGIGGRGGRVEDAARLGLAGEAGLSTSRGSMVLSVAMAIS